MRTSNAVPKASFKLLYADFKRIEEITPDFPDLISSRKSKSQKKTFLTSARVNEQSHLAQSAEYDSEFEKLTLEEQVQTIMEPLPDSSNPPESYYRQLPLQTNPSIPHREPSQIAEIPLDLGISSSSRLVSDDFVNVHSEPHKKDPSVEHSRIRSPKYSVVLPSIGHKDPFESDAAANFWTFSQPVKYYNTSTRANSIVNVSVLSEAYRNSLRTDVNSPNSPQPKNRKPLPIVTKHIKTHSMGLPTSSSVKSLKKSVYHKVHSSLSLKAKGENSSLKADDENRVIDGTMEDPMVVSIIQQLNDPSRGVIGESIITTKNVENVKGTSNIAKHLLNFNNPQDKSISKLDRKLLEMSQIKSQNRLADADKRLVTTEGDEFDFMREDPSMSPKKMLKHSRLSSETNHLPVIRSHNKFKPVSDFELGSPGAKKEFYNKWYMPVGLWQVEKEDYSRSKRNEQLKKNLSYFYQNMHVLGMKDARNPLKGVGVKSPQQKNYEDIQGIMNQNVTIKKFKKSLVDSHSRIPSFLQNVDDGPKPKKIA